MDNKNPQNEIKIELSPEVARGLYSNLAMIAHTPNEFILDFISMTPTPPQARVQARMFMTPDNAKKLLFALRENIERYEANFGVIEPKRPVGGGNPDLSNPFKA